MDDQTLLAFLRSMKENVEFQVEALRKLVHENFSPAQCCHAVDLNYALLGVDAIAASLDELSLRAGEVVTAASNAVLPADVDPSHDVDPDDVIPADYVEAPVPYQTGCDGASSDSASDSHLNL